MGNKEDFDEDMQSMTSAGRRGADIAALIVENLALIAQNGCENTDQRNYPDSSCRTDRERSKHAKYAGEDWCPGCLAQEVLDRLQFIGKDKPRELQRDGDIVAARAIAASKSKQTGKNFNNFLGGRYDHAYGVQTALAAMRYVRGGEPTLRSTGRTIKFTDVNIGHPFFAHEKFWIRTDFNAACELGGSTRHTSWCNFVTDPMDEYVTEVKFSE